MVSSPMFAPRLIPETIMSGISSSRPVTARCTQSVGVPFTKRKPFADSRTERGRSSVRELDAPLWSRSGATTVIEPTSARVFARIARPGAKYPSSLLSRIRIYNLLIHKANFSRPQPGEGRPELDGFYSKRWGRARKLGGCCPDVRGCWISHRRPESGRPLEAERLGRVLTLGEPHLAEESGPEPLCIVVYANLKIQRERAALGTGRQTVRDPVGERHARTLPTHNPELRNRTHGVPLLANFLQAIQQASCQAPLRGHSMPRQRFSLVKEYPAKKPCRYSSRSPSG